MNTVVNVVLAALSFAAFVFFSTNAVVNSAPAKRQRVEHVEDAAHDPLTTEAELQSEDPEAFAALQRWRDNGFDAYTLNADPGMYARAKRLLDREIEISSANKIYWEAKVNARALHSQ